MQPPTAKQYSDTRAFWAIQEWDTNGGPARWLIDEDHTFASEAAAREWFELCDARTHRIVKLTVEMVK